MKKIIDDIKEEMEEVIESYTVCIYEEQQGIFTEVMNCETEQEKRMLDCYMEGQKMICDNAYYKKGEKKPRCHKINDDRCPLIYYCPIAKQYENTSAMFTCVYRGDSNEKRR